MFYMLLDMSMNPSFSLCMLSFQIGTDAHASVVESFNRVDLTPILSRIHILFLRIVNVGSVCDIISTS